MTIKASADAVEVRAALGLGEEHREWTEALEWTPADDHEAELPAGQQLTSLLTRLKLPVEDQAEMAEAAEEAIEPDTPWRWLLDRTVASLRATMGLDTLMPPRPALTTDSPTGRWLTVLACLAVVPDVRALHARMEVPDEVSWASLGILGEKAAVRRRTLAGARAGAGTEVEAEAKAPFSYDNYLLPVFQGRRYRLDGLDCRASNVSIDVRLPYGTEPFGILPDMAWAHEIHYFFRRLPRRYADGVRFGYDAIPCRIGSWINDPAVGDYLPEDHEIRRFIRKCQHFSHYGPGPADETGLTSGDRDALEQTFGQSPANRETALHLTPTTPVQQAVLEHLGAGNHWALDHCGQAIWDYSPYPRRAT
ncbi:acyltransferase domain-containing protein [Streptomyces sp. TRM49041]|uniref:acyltransferase domain-containing protein n=1 Tax=Streptomyces sp. TRM49041 TaxID=2603216 RepID=UPI0021CCF671|nr:acyltransferase domain-containing protein [Streptomyces sp. TRM49041]